MASKGIGAMLDELMGRNRNLGPDDKVKNAFKISHIGPLESITLVTTVPEAAHEIPEAGFKVTESQ